MLKLPLAVLLLAGTCSAQDAHPITQLQGSARVLIVFAPDTNSVNYKRQLQLMERHSYELTERNIVVVPVSPVAVTSESGFNGENLPLETIGDQAEARSRFHVQPGDFLVILITQDGTEQIRSTNPVDIHQLVAKLDSLPRH
jgi:hypothetical protein